MIKREIGDCRIFTGGVETSPIVTVMRYTELCDKALHIEQDSGGVLVSVETLKAIIAWAEKKD